jgi:hypothetical protein
MPRAETQACIRFQGYVISALAIPKLNAFDLMHAWVQRLDSEGMHAIPHVHSMLKIELPDLMGSICDACRPESGKDECHRTWI